MVVALLSLGSTTVNVGMWSSSPCVVCVVSKLAMKSCILVGMDVISQAKVAVVRAYRLGVFREGSEFVLTLRTGLGGVMVRPKTHSRLALSGQAPSFQS